MQITIDFGSEKDKQRLYEVLKTRKPRRYRIEIVEDRAKRSNNQNDYYFGVICKVISEHTGMNVDETHESLKRMFNPKQVVSKTTGSILIKGGSTTSFTTAEAEAYYEQIRTYFLTDWDVYIPLPNEYENINN